MAKLPNFECGDYKNLYNLPIDFYGEIWYNNIRKRKGDGTMKRNRKVKVRNFLNTYTGEVVLTMNWTRRKRNELKTRNGKPSDWIITEKPLAELYESVNYRG